MRARSSAPALIVALAATGALTAAPSGGSEEEPETVRVEGRGETAPTDLTGSVTVIRAEEFQSRITTLAELLEERAGLRVRSFGGLGSFATVSIRGSTSEQVNVYVDGVLLNQALGGGVNLADLPLHGVESIEIYRGFTPAFLPSGSIGGAINIRTRPPSGTRTTGSVTAGSWKTFGATGSISRDGRRADGLISLDVTRSSGDFRFFDANGTPQEGSDDGFETRTNNRFRQADLVARALVGTAGPARFDLQGGFTSRRQGVPGIDAFQSEHARSTMSRAFARAGLRRDDLAGGALRMDLDLQYTHTVQGFEDRAGETTGGTAADTRHTLDAAGPSLLLRWHPPAAPASAHFVTMQVGLRRDSARLRDAANPEPDRGGGARLVAGISVEDEVHLAGGRVVLAPSARWDRVSSQFTGQEDRLDSSLSGRLGAAWRPHPRLSLRVGAGRFFREPSLTEMFGDQGTVKGGGADLRPEVGWSYDAGVDFSAPAAGPIDHLSLEAGIFRRDVDDLIQLVLTSQSQATAVNTGRARIVGAELTAGLGLFGWLGGTLSYTWQVPEDRSDTFRRGSDLPLRPRHVASARATATRAWGRPFYTFEYVGPDYYDAAAAAIASSPGARIGRDFYRVPGRYFHGVGFTRPAGSRLEIDVEVDNILNVRTVDVARYPLPGRTVQVRLRTTLP